MPSFNAAVIAQAMMQAVGINAEIEVLEWATQLDRYNKGNYQMQSFSYSARLDPALGFEQFCRPEGQAAAQGLGRSGGAGAARQVDRWSPTQAERQKIFDELHKRHDRSDVPLIIFSTAWKPGAHSKRVQGADAVGSRKLRIWGVQAVQPNRRAGPGEGNGHAAFAITTDPRWRCRPC